MVTKSRLLVLAAILMIAELLYADDGLTVTSALPYDFTTLEVTGTAAAGEVTLTVGDKTATTTLASAGAYTLAVDGLTAGSICSYVVSQGGASKGGYVIMAGRTDTVFGATPTALTAGGWDTAPQAADGKFVFLGSESRFTLNSASSAKVVYVDSAMTFEDGADELGTMDNALGAFTLAQTNETGDAVYFWAGYANGEWIELTGSVTPKVGEYISRMEYMFDNEQKRVRYSLKSGDADFTVLRDGAGNEWFEIAEDASAGLCRSPRRSMHIRIVRSRTFASKGAICLAASKS